MDETSHLKFGTHVNRGDRAMATDDKLPQRGRWQSHVTHLYFDKIK